MAPPKLKNQVYLEYSKVAYFCRDQRLACAILNRAIGEYPDEWKLELEYVLQLVRMRSLSHC